MLEATTRAMTKIITTNILMIQTSSLELDGSFGELIGIGVLVGGPGL